MPSIIERIIGWKRRKVLENQARVEYAQARGTAHKKLLNEALTQGQKQLHKTEQQMKGLQDQLQLARSNLNTQLRQRLEHHIVNEHLTEVPGIGQKLSQAIIEIAFRNAITDLRNASSMVPGVGENKQLAINLWIENYQKRIPKLLQEGFPGKAEIIASSTTKIKDIEKQLANLQQEKNVLEQQYKRADEVFKQLNNVTADVFVLATLNGNTGNVEIDEYQRGVYAEWEPIPEWFQEIILGK